jgi:putative NADPH-quinone reductase
VTSLRDAMRMVIDEFTLTYPGIKNVEHEYFYAVHDADDATRRATWRKLMPSVVGSDRE